MKKFNFKKYMFLCLVFITSFFAFNGMVRAYENNTIDVNVGVGKTWNGGFENGYNVVCAYAQGSSSNAASYTLSNNNTKITISGRSNGTTKINCSLSQNGKTQEVTTFNITVGDGDSEPKKIAFFTYLDNKTNSLYISNSNSTECTFTTPNIVKVDKLFGTSLIGINAGKTEATCTTGSKIEKYDITVYDRIVTGLSVTVNPGENINIKNLVRNKLGLDMDLENRVYTNFYHDNASLSWNETNNSLTAPNEYDKGVIVVSVSSKATFSSEVYTLANINVIVNNPSNSGNSNNSPITITKRIEVNVNESKNLWLDESDSKGYLVTDIFQNGGCTNRASLSVDDGGHSITIGGQRGGNCTYILNTTSSNVKYNVSVTVNDASGGGNSGNGSTGYTPVTSIGSNNSSDSSSNIVGRLRDDGLCDSYTIRTHPDYEWNVAKYYVPKAGAIHSLHLYQGVDNCNGNVYTALCYDPTKRNPDATTPYKAQDYVYPFDDNDAFITSNGNEGVGNSSKSIEAYALSLIQHHYSEINDTAWGKVAAQIALRTYIYGAHENLGGGTTGEQRYYRYLFCAWGNQPCEQSEWEGRYFSLAAQENISADGILQKAKEWWNEAQAAGNACLSGTCEPMAGVLEKVGYEVYFDSVLSNDRCTIGEDNIQRTYTITGRITGLKAYNDMPQSIITIKDFACPPGLNCKIYLDDTPITLGAKNNLKGHGDSVNLKIELIGDICSLNSLDNMLDLKIESWHPYDWHNIITVSPKVGNYQRMILILTNTFIATYNPKNNGDNNNNGLDLNKMKDDCKCGQNDCNTPELTPGTSTFNPELFKKSECCTNVNKQTTVQKNWVNQNGGSDVYCKMNACGDVQWDVYCGPQDNHSAAGDTLNYHIREAVDNVTKQNDYAKCVIENGKDNAGNTYLEDTVSYGNTTFCNIYCTEEWDMKLPGYLKNVYAGTGFNLAIKKVQGKRVCFTNDIRVDLFENLLNEKNEQIVNAYNDWARAKVLKKAYTDAQRDSIDASNETATGSGYHDSNGNSCQAYTIGCYRDSASCSNDEPGHSNHKKATISTSYTPYKYVKGRTSNGSFGSITTISPITTSGTYGSETYSYSSGSCSHSYTSIESAFISGIDLLKNSGKTNLKDIVTYYEGIYKTRVSEREALISSYSKCSNYTTNFDWNDGTSGPNISYVYADSEMMNKITEGNNVFEVDGKIKNTKDLLYCRNGRNSTFTGCSSGGSEKSENNQWNLPVLSGESLTTSVASLPANKYVKKSETNSAAYNIKGSFFVEHTTGYVSYEEAPTREDLNKQEYVGKYWSSYYHTDDRVVPVSTTLPQGIYQYQLRFENIGMYNGKDQTNKNTKYGRLIGGTDGKGASSVLKSFNKSNETATTETCYFEIGETSSLCHCCGKDVEVRVVSLEICPYGNCGKVSDSYLTDKADLAYFARTVSLNDLNPNNRQLGSNWGGTREGTLYEFESQSIAKGQATKAAIEQSGNSVYETPQYSYTMTPSGIVSIKNASGNYSNNTLECNSNGVNCLSKFLDDIDDLNGVTVNKRNTEFTSYSVDGRSLSWK